MKTLLKQNQSGIAAIEFALMAPLLMAILLGVLEFGVYFTKSSVVSRAVSNISTAIQMSPTATNLQTDAQNSGFGLVSFTGSNFFCAKAYSDRDAAGSYCIAGEWFTGTPAGHPAGTPYYVAIVASVQNTPISGITSFLPDMVVRNIVQVGGTSSGESPIIGYKAQIQNAGIGFNNVQVLGTGPATVNGTEITYTPVSPTSRIQMDFKFFGATQNPIGYAWGVQGQPTNCNNCYMQTHISDSQGYVDWRWITPSWGTTPRTMKLDVIEVNPGWPTKLGVTRYINTHGYMEIMQPASVIITEFRE
jgi:Flp pilus assembly pilin Flp